MKDNERKVLDVLRGLADESGRVAKKQADIARDAGMPGSTLVGILKRLEAAGEIGRDANGVIVVGRPAVQHPNAPEARREVPAEATEIVMPTSVDREPSDTREIISVDASGVEALNRSEIDQAIQAARRWPRAINTFIDRTRALVLSSVDTADACIYALPRDGKMIEGPSIRFAEILLYGWGNIRTASRVVRESDQFITAQGVFFDLESNVIVSSEVSRRIVNKHGKRFGVDMIGITAQAAASIALRNAILRGIPKPIWEPIYLTARALVAGDYKSLPQRRDQALSFLAKQGVSAGRVLAALNIDAVNDITPEHIVVLRGMVASLKDRESTIEELFPDEVPSLFGVPRRDLTERLRAGKEVARENDSPAAQAGAATARAAGGTDVQSKAAAPAQAGIPAGRDLLGDAGAARMGDDDRRSDAANAAGRDPVVASVPANGNGDRLTADEETLIAEFKAAIEGASTTKEIEVVRGEFQGAYNHARPLVAQRMAKIENDRNSALAVKQL